jgi:very-short-patch-repair endonuclease
MTEQEKKLWYLFLKGYPIRFLRQKVMDRFIVDFYCASAKLVIELDGRQHCEEDAVIYDNERSAILEGLGLRVIRFANLAVDRHFEAVCKKIHAEVMSRAASPKPPPVTS